MKIAIFSDTFQVNGVTSIVYESAKGLTELGHEVCIFAIGKNLKKTSNANTSANLTLIPLPSLPAGWIYPKERLYVPLGFSYQKLKKFAPDIIHTHMPFTLGWEAIILARLLKIPVIGTHHTFYDHYLKHVKIDYNWGRKFSWKYTIGFYNFCDLVLSPSESLAKVMTDQKLKKPIMVLENFIDTQTFSPIENKEQQKILKKKFGLQGESLVYMGRLSYEKSVDQIIKAFALVLKNSPLAQLLIVGDGPEKENLVRLSHQLGLSKNIIFTGFLRGEKLVEALQANDIFVTASLSESFSLTIVEAMSCGLPIVAVREKGPAEIVKNNTNGFFAQPNNPQELAEKITELLNSPEKLESFGLASRKLAMNYSKKSIIAKLEALYKDIINKK